MKRKPNGPAVVARYVVIFPVLLMQFPPVFKLNSRLQFAQVAIPTAKTEWIAAHGYGIIIKTDWALCIKSIEMISTSIIRKITIAHDKTVIHSYSCAIPTFCILCIKIVYSVLTLI